MAVDREFNGSDREVEREVHREIRHETAGEPPSAPRIVRDATGTGWKVTEVSGRCVPGARGDSCLVFESECAIRRVWQFPRKWRELPAPELIQVSWNR